MKKTLLILCACLFGVLSGAKAYTVDDLTSAGWALATNLDDITDNVYVFVDAGAQATAVVRGAEQGTRPRYNTLSNPIFNKQEVWAIEKYGDNYAILGIEDNYYFSSGSEGWNNAMTNGVEDNNKGLFTFTISGQKYDIRSAAFSGNSYMGPWNNEGSVDLSGSRSSHDWTGTDGMEDVAVNKSSAQAPGYLLYKMAKRVYLRKYLQQVPNLAAPVDVSYLIFNSKIYQSGAATDKPLGWDNYGDHKTGDNKYTQGTGNTRLQAWRYDNGTITLDFDYYQGISTLPGGKYRIQTIGKGSPTRVKSYLYINNSSTSTKLSKELDSSTDYTTFTTDYLVIGDGHNITIGMEADGSHWAGTSNHTAEAFGDDFHLETDPYLSTMATELPGNGAMTAGLWYHFRVDNTGNHILTATNLSNIIYATGSTTALSAAGSATFTATQELTAGTDYYVRSSSDNTLTITPCISSVATALPADGAMTAGNWFYFDIATAGHYDVVATSLANIVYTTDGDAAQDASIGNHFTVKDNDLTVTRYYVKSSSAQTLRWYLTDEQNYDSRLSSAVDDWSCVEGKTVATYPSQNPKGVEVYYGNNTSFPIGNTLYQEITDLPNGNYEVVLWAWENFAPWDKDSNPHPTGDNIAQVFANDVAYNINVIENIGGRDWDDANKYTLNCHVTAGTLTYGVKNIAEGGNWVVCRPISLKYTGPYNKIVEDVGTKTQTYEGTFTEDVDLTPTVECPIVDITGATFTGEISVVFSENPNGLIYATSAQKIAINDGKDEPVKNVISNNICDKLVITDGTPFVAPEDFEATQATYSRGDVSNTFGTICLPFAVSSDANVQYYTTDQIDGNVLKLTEVDNVAAGTPAIFKKKNSKAEITAAANNVAIIKDAGEAGTSVKLVGVFERTTLGDEEPHAGTAANNYYYIKNNQFWQGKKFFYIPAFRAYLDTQALGEARLSLQIDDETTAINELKTLDEKQGLKDGKYLIGGKIIVVKDGKQFNVNGVLK